MLITGVLDVSGRKWGCVSETSEIEQEWENYAGVKHLLLPLAVL